MGGDHGCRVGAIAGETDAGYAFAEDRPVDAALILVVELQFGDSGRDLHLALDAREHLVEELLHFFVLARSRAHDQQAALAIPNHRRRFAGLGGPRGR